AIVCFSTAVDLKPDYVTAYCNLGRAFLVIGKLQEAGACLLHAHKLSHHNVEVKIELAKVYLLAGSPAEAKRYAADALGAPPANPHLLYVMGHALQCEGQSAEASKFLRSAAAAVEGLPAGAYPGLAESIRKDLAAAACTAP